MVPSAPRNWPLLRTLGFACKSFPSISLLSSLPLSVFVIPPLTSRGSAPHHTAGAIRPCSPSSFYIRLRVSPQDSSSSAGSSELTGIKELDDLSQEIAQLQRWDPALRAAALFPFLWARRGREGASNRCSPPFLRHSFLINVFILWLWLFYLFF